MKRCSVKNINTPCYWNTHQTAMDFGLRQKEYLRLLKGDSVVELGCGLSPFLSRSRVKMRMGVDYSPVTISTCVRTYPKVAYVLADATKTPFVDKQFDTVVSGEVLEHLEHPRQLIKEMKRLAKKRIILSTPILEFHDPEHLWEFSLSDLKKLLPGCRAYGIPSRRFPGRTYLFAYLDL